MSSFNFLRDKYNLFNRLVDEDTDCREFILERIILLKSRLLPPDVENFSDPEDRALVSFLERNGVSYHIKSNTGKGFALIYLTRREAETLQSLARTPYLKDQQI